YGADHAIIQRTASACPPILNIETGAHQHCKEINAHILELIKTTRPRKIVLAANWTRYDWRLIGGTIEQLRGAGFNDIDLVGPGPQWVSSLPDQLYRRFKSDPSLPVPQRMASGLRDNFAQLDTQIADYAAGLKVNYLSPARIFCDQNGCVTRLGNTGDTITFWDCCHLTDAGSRFLVSNIARINGQP
ncbi:MAG: SGNH hydrolase domain-containing protein, partial [Betaproteobacteria bacterium]